jgi:peptide/histidine transporter 3/4
MALMTLATGVLVSGAASSTVNLAFFFISFYLVSIGCGGFQPNLQSLGADQFDTEGEKAAFFTRYLVLNNLGIALGDTVIVYVVTAKGWVFGFSMCTVVGFMGLASFLCGFPVFRQYKNKGNSYARALKVVVAAARKWHLELPLDSSSLYREEEGEEKGHGSRLHVNHTNTFR